MLDGKIKVSIGKEKIEIDTREVCLITDVSTGMDEVAAQIAWYGELLGAAEAEKVRADSAYRRWRGKVSKDALKKDPKVAEWKVKAEIESSETFSQYKEAIAQTECQVNALRNLVLALKEKSPNLRSKGARLRAEYDSTDMSTKAADNKDQLRDRHDAHTGGNKDGKPITSGKRPRR